MDQGGANTRMICEKIGKTPDMVRKRRNKFVKRGMLKLRPRTIKKIDTLTTLFGQGKTDDEIALALGYSVATVRTRRVELGLKRADQPKALRREGVEVLILPQIKMTKSAWREEDGCLVREIWAL
jgi:DNA-directed RNA polymerase specialized sigma subunit